MAFYVTRRDFGDRKTIAQTDTWHEATAIVKAKSQEEPDVWFSVTKRPLLNWKLQNQTNSTEDK